MALKDKLIYIQLYAFLFLFTGAAGAIMDKEGVVAVTLMAEECQSQYGAVPIRVSNISSEAIESLSKNFVDRYGDECSITGILIGGPIKRGAFNNFVAASELLERVNDDNPFQELVYLNSPGGLVSEAMTIGDYIAGRGMQSLIAQDDICYSSCVFILAASASRYIQGNVGIHRPFSSELSTKNLNYAQYLQKYDSMEPELKRYFSKYGVSPAIVDQMSAIPSDEIVMLSSEKRDEYGLGLQNVAKQEFDKARIIQRCGTKYQKLTRKHEALVERCITKESKRLTERGGGATTDVAIDIAFKCERRADAAIAGYAEERERCERLMEQEPNR